MAWKKIGRALLFPHVAIMAALIPIATALLVYSMVALGTDAVLSYASYLLSAYTLTVWCVRIPRIVKAFGNFKRKNRYAKRWHEDARFRVNVSLYGSLLWNSLYGVFQLWLGIYHHTFWFSSFGAYYILLAIMRFFLVSHTRKYAPGDMMESEFKKYRACGIVLLLMNLALALIVFFMVYWNRTFTHHMITAISMAAYTFTALTVAIINVIKYRKYNSPVFSASKIISLVAALVSMLTLESTMLTAFGDGTMTAFGQKLMLGATGGAISLSTIIAAIYMIAVSTRKIKRINSEVENGK